MTVVVEKAILESPIPAATRRFQDEQCREAHVWLAHISRLSTAPELQDKMLIDQDEVARRDRMVQFDQRKMFDCSHRFLRHLLSQYVGCPASGIQYDRRPRGKPVLKDNPSGFTFSLSHSSRYCAIAIAMGSEIGVDIEEVRDFRPSDNDPCLGLGSVLSASERRELNRLPTDRRVASLLQLWTLKEAAVKATGDGLHKQLCRYSFAGFKESSMEISNGDETLNCRILPLPSELLGAFSSLGTDTNIHLSWL